MDQSVVYEHLQGNVADMLAVGSGRLSVERTGCFLCLAGRAEISLDGRSYVLESGSLCVYFPLTVLEVKRRSDDLDGLMMAVEIEAVSPLIARITDIDAVLAIRQRPVVRLSAQMTRVVHGYMTMYRHHQDLATQYASQRGGARLWQLNNLQLDRAKECLMLQLMIAFTQEDSQVKSVANRKDEIVRIFLNDLRQHYRQEHEVQFYAARQYLSMRYFSFVVRERTSQTPSQWIASTLLNDARQLLSSSNHSVKQIAQLLYFPSQSYFGKWFKAHMGMGPKEFRGRSPELDA